MNTLKGWITTTFLVATLVLSSTSAHGGIIVAGLNDKADPCTELPGKDKVDYGIIVAGVTGIIIFGFSGIIVAGVTTEEPVNCGIIVAG